MDLISRRRRVMVGIFGYCSDDYLGPDEKVRAPSLHRLLSDVGLWLKQENLRSQINMYSCWDWSLITYDCRLFRWIPAWIGKREWVVTGWKLMNSRGSDFRHSPGTRICRQSLLLRINSLVQLIILQWPTECAWVSYIDVSLLFRECFRRRQALVHSHEQAYPLSIEFPLGIRCSISKLVQHATKQ